MKTKRNDFLIHTNFLTIILINFNLLLRKGVYPYGYMDNLEKLNITSKRKRRFLQSPILGRYY